MFTLKDFETKIPKKGKEIKETEQELLSIQPPVNIQVGGQRFPNCIPKFKIAIIVPYRNRLNSLKCFLSFFHNFFIEQNIHYGIYLVEPFNDQITFNRGILMNIGFREALKDYEDWDCFFFHDVDMFPMDKRLIYECNSTLPKHFSVAVSKFKFK